MHNEEKDQVLSTFIRCISVAFCYDDRLKTYFSRLDKIFQMSNKQQLALEKSTVVVKRKGAGMGDNLGCV